MSFKEIVPFAVPALVNRVRQRVPAVGRFHNEWTEKEIRNARVVLMDVHWYLSIPGAIRLSHELKRANPDVKIVAGGLSATLFAKPLLRDSAIDFIIRGDALASTEALVRSVIEDAPADAVPNVIAREFENPVSYAMSAEEFGEADFRDVSWFPSLRKAVVRIHRQSKGMAWPIHPWLIFYLGCPYDCAARCYGPVPALQQEVVQTAAVQPERPELRDQACYASTPNHRRLFRRGLLIRPPERVREDLIAFKEDPDIRILHLVNDFSMLPPSYGERVLDQEYGLDISYLLIRLPTEDGLGRLLGAFRGGDLVFLHHWMDPDLRDAFVDRVLQAKATRRFRVWLTYSRVFCERLPGYAETLNAIRRRVRCPAYEMDEWWDFAPDIGEDGTGTEEQYQACLRRERIYAWHNLMFGVAMRCQYYSPRFTQAVLALRRARIGEWLRKVRL
ncbi:MAG TPA: hypothetical protein PK468_09485 [Candidatus Hydrogenedentes bacterium]|nr:hypothetical protein [Candidatus Hydrogenedentota bacterium]